MTDLGGSEGTTNKRVSLRRSDADYGDSGYVSATLSSLSPTLDLVLL